jgi:hypothetical protein
MHGLGEIWILKRKLMGFFFQKHLIFAVSEVHFLVHKMLINTNIIKQKQYILLLSRLKCKEKSSNKNDSREDIY